MKFSGGRVEPRRDVGGEGPFAQWERIEAAVGGRDRDLDGHFEVADLAAVAVGGVGEGAAYLVASHAQRARAFRDRAGGRVSARRGDVVVRG
ncbi:MAG: hypothetical protein ACK5CF_10810 [Opitutaceae bacterium]